MGRVDKWGCVKGKPQGARLHSLRWAPFAIRAPEDSLRSSSEVPLAWLAGHSLRASASGLRCLRRPGWIERPAPFFPTRVRMCVQLTAVAGRIGNMGGTGRGRLSSAALLGKLRFPVLDSGADASTERAVSLRAERAKASESQPAQRSEQDCLARRTAKRAASAWPTGERPRLARTASEASRERPPSRAGGGFPHIRVLQFLPRGTKVTGPEISFN